MRGDRPAGGSFAPSQRGTMCILAVLSGEYPGGVRGSACLGLGVGVRCYCSRGLFIGFCYKVHVAFLVSWVLWIDSVGVSTQRK
jgi:hypothetical protein